MREADRRAAERLSVLDRPRTDTDALPAHVRAAPPRPWAERVDETTIRLALVVDDRRIYVGRSVDDDIFQFFFDSDGASISGGPRSVLVSHGAKVGWSWNEHRCVVHGIVPDPVTAVRVGPVEAIVANNAFVADMRSRKGPIVLTTQDGERVVPAPRVPRFTNGPTTTPVNPRGYFGLIEYAWSGYTRIEIDDLDSPNWQGTPTGGFVANATAPDVWFVGVVLLEGPRAGELATAGLMVQQDDNGVTRAVRFLGKSAFGPHPDPPRLEAARRRLEELRQGLEWLGRA